MCSIEFKGVADFLLCFCICPSSCRKAIIPSWFGEMMKRHAFLLGTKFAIPQFFIYWRRLIPFVSAAGGGEVSIAIATSSPFHPQHVFHSDELCQR